MKRHLGGLMLAATLAWAVPARAEPVPAPADLPPAAAVEQALDAHPLVRAARADLRGAQAERRLLRAGEHEFGLNLATQRRNVSNGPDYTEWSVALLRGVRLAGKAELDDRIGAQGELAALERIGDARHEAARQLLGYWYAARQAGAEVDIWRRQVDLLREEKRVVDLRVRRGDAARLDTLQAEAALAQARSQLAAAQAREQTALAELGARFPELPAPAASAAAPVVPEGDLAAWRARVLEHNHELLMVQRQLEQARLQARRAEADRRPDPVLGMHVASEQGGNEHLIGVSLSIPLPGEARNARVQSRLAQAEALAEAEAATRRRLLAEAGANWQRAAAGVESWQRLAEAEAAVSRHADLARRAHELGELGLSDTLLARRAALDAQLAAAQARIAGNEAVARLLLDAHRLWPLDDDDEHR